ncbi:MAG: isochorismatase family protein [Planctomycetales bacterium]|nr:isochorismatase family protein [Planctomycetales bacterium]
MSEPNAKSPALPRSPELLSARESALLVVDVQEKLIGGIRNHRSVVWNIRRLLDGARTLAVPFAGTEQYPQGLGGTIAPLADYFESLPEKLMFSCRECETIFRQWSDRGIRQILVVGIETHVCLAQTVFDLLAAGFQVYVAVDAVGARGEIDHETALRRIDSCGATLTTTEAALFEWCEKAGSPEFKIISQLVREDPPSE